MNDINLLKTMKELKYCPLCHKPWKAVEQEGKTGKIFFVCLESSCMIWIWVRDPALGQYEKMMDEEPIPCPNPSCGEKKMRVFYRLQDGYMKMRCPKCTASIEEHDPDKHGQIAPNTPVIEEDGKGGILYTKGNDFERN